MEALPISTMPREGQFLALHPESGEWRQVEYYDSPWVKLQGISVINRRTGKWFATDWWAPLPTVTTETT